MGTDGPYPACGFEVFIEPSGSYDICPVCGWEDDGVPLRFPALRGGASDAEVATAFGLRPEGMKARRRRLAKSFKEWLDR